MGLKVKLKPGERLIVNGAVLRNGQRRLDVEIENRADVLRGNELVDAKSAVTPVRRLVHLIQMALVSREHRSEILPQIENSISDLESALEKSHGQTLRAARAQVHQGEFYGAYRMLKPVILHEDFLLALPPADPDRT